MRCHGGASRRAGGALRCAAWSVRRRLARDDGSVSVLTIGLMVVTLMVVLVVASATAVHLARARLANLADELAVDAADAMNSGSYYSGAVGPGESPELSAQRMADAAAQHLAGRATGSLEGTRIVSVTTGDGGSARVTVELTVYPLFGLEALMPFADGITLTAQGEARNF